MRETLCSYHQEFGYSPHSLVAISEKSSGWEATCARGAVCYLEVGRTWLAAEPLTAEADLGAVASEFLEHADSLGRFAVFLPVTERMARAGLAIGLDCVALGKSPYFDLSTWRCTGRRLYTVRKELNKAARAGVTLTCVPGADLPGDEILALQKAWVNTRRTQGLSWIFTPDTFNFPDYQKHFLARNADGKLVGLLSAAPLPARRAFYFKDLNRYPGAPKGTADLLLVGAIDHLREAGFDLATPGTVPLLDIRHPEALSSGNYAMVLRLMGFIRRRCEGLYSFSGLHAFKARFAPTWWEYEYALARRTQFASLRVAVATARAVMPGGVIPALWKEPSAQFRPGPSRT